MRFGKHSPHNLSAYLHGELSAEDARRVTEHLRQCSQCQTEFEEIKFGAHLAAQLVREPAPDSLWNELEAAMKAQMAPPPSKAKWTTSPAFKWAMATAVVLLISVAAFRFYWRQPQADLTGLPSWEVTRLAGAPTIGKRRFDTTDRLPRGEWLVTDEQSRAQISVGVIGEVKVEPNSRVQLLSARDDEHRLALASGKLQAFIWAPPRQFFVDTPSAVAVDLGCSYTLEVGADGVGRLQVTMGWVAFEWQGRESFVPAEAVCVTRPGFGPGTPHFNDATAAFQHALAAFDIAPNPVARATALDTVLAQTRKRDALTLWHLLARTEGNERSRVFDRLAQWIPLPPHVTREGILGGDHAMLDAWWEKLDLGDAEWWRMWKGPLPSTTK